MKHLMPYLINQYNYGLAQKIYTLYSQVSLPLLTNSVIFCLQKSLNNPVNYHNFLYGSANMQNHF